MIRQEAQRRRSRAQIYIAAEAQEAERQSRRRQSGPYLFRYGSAAAEAKAGGRADAARRQAEAKSPQQSPAGMKGRPYLFRYGAGAEGRHRGRPRSSLGAEAQQHGRGAEAAPYERQAEKPQRAPQRGEEPRRYTQV